jgi:hypothetical protein
MRRDMVLQCASIETRRAWQAASESEVQTPRFYPCRFGRSRLNPCLLRIGKARSWIGRRLDEPHRLGPLHDFWRKSKIIK